MSIFLSTITQDDAVALHMCNILITLMKYVTLVYYLLPSVCTGKCLWKVFLNCRVCHVEKSCHFAVSVYWVKFPFLASFCKLAKKYISKTLLPTKAFCYCCVWRWFIFWQLPSITTTMTILMHSYIVLPFSFERLDVNSLQFYRKMRNKLLKIF